MALTRRQFSMLLTTGLAALSYGKIALAETKHSDALSKKLLELEHKLGARLGAFIFDTQTGKQWQQRADERFPMCSTFKLLACGALLTKVDAGKENLQRRIAIDASEVVTYSPVTEKHVGTSDMTLADICEAAITRSDNTAANVILKSLSGPPAITDFVRTLGDSVSRLDRFETELNEATPGDARDTTTPRAMAGNIIKLLIEDKLSVQSREQLKSWLIANKTGDAKLRAGLPPKWKVGDKTGSGNYGTVNDVAIIWPPNRKPIIAAIYITETKASFEDCNSAIAAIGKEIAATI